jgi:hypothetical protein
MLREQHTLRAKIMWHRIRPLLPWGNLAWGIGSAFFITRNLSDPTPILAAGLALVLLTFFINLRTEDASRKDRLATVARRGTSMAVQSSAQYALAFTLPLLVTSGNTLAAVVSFPLTAVSLWDPWWERMHQQPLFLIAIRTWTMSLLVSVLCTVVIPNGLRFFFPLQLLAILFSSGLWTKTSHCARTNPRWAGALLSAVFVATCAVQWAFTLHGPFPALGVWVQSGAFTKGKPRFLSRDQIDSPLSFLTTDAWARQSESNDETTRSGGICCVTPIIGARGFRAPLSHRWLVNGQMSDEIALPPAAGNGEEAAYRTYSCKRNFPPLFAGDTLVCQTVAQGRVVLGAVRLKIGAEP